MKDAPEVGSGRKCFVEVLLGRKKQVFFGNDSQQSDCQGFVLEFLKEFLQKFIKGFISACFELPTVALLKP